MRKKLEKDMRPKENFCLQYGKYLAMSVLKRGILQKEKRLKLMGKRGLTYVRCMRSHAPILSPQNTILDLQSRQNFGL